MVVLNSVCAENGARKLKIHVR